MSKPELQRLRGDRIRHLRKHMNLSQFDLSAALRQRGVEVNQSWISQVEQGKGGLKTDALRRLADILECSTDYLLGVTDDPTARADLENQVLLIEQDPERRAMVQEVFTNVARMPSDLRDQYYHAIRALYVGLATEARQKR